MKITNLKQLARFTDSLSFLYLEHAVIEKEDQSIAAFTPDGRVSLPAANLSTLLLGPGTRITHAAINVLANCGCTVCWVGDEGLRHYAAGQNKTRSSAAIERQCLAWANPEQRMRVVRRLYELRFREPIPASMSLQQIRGREGARVRDAYRDLALQHGITWTKRDYQSDDWKAADPVNRALSATNAALYAVALSALHAMGYSPALGFVHTGKQLSFVYDLADVFKLECTVPAAFAAAAEGAAQVESRARKLFREHAIQTQLLDRLQATLIDLFGKVAPAVDATAGGVADLDRNAALPGQLWDSAGNVNGGVQYAGDGA